MTSPIATITVLLTMSSERRETDATIDSHLGAEPSGSSCDLASQGLMKNLQMARRPFGPDLEADLPITSLIKFASSARYGFGRCIAKGFKPPPTMSAMGA